PNILFIMTDQQSARMMSCTGNKWLKTPALDRLAASGIRFERAYACNPVCVPSRFSLQTGLMPSAIGMGRNEDSEQSQVTDAMIRNSLGNLFKNAGYETVYGGKVHLPKRMNNVRDLGYRMLTGNSRQELADKCAEFIKGEHSRPFFLFASFINPHDICYMAINDFNRSNGDSAIENIDSRTCEALLEPARKSENVEAFVAEHCPPLPENHEIPGGEPECISTKYTQARPFREWARRNWTESQWRLHRWAYCRLTEMVDAEIGKVLDAVEQAGLQDKTLIVFTSDHGDMDSAHKLEHKSILYEEAVRIPFIMSYKNVIPKGRIDDTHLVSNGLDLLPTLCDYANIKAPQGLPGLSVRRLAEGKSARNWRDHIVVESQNGRMLRTDRYKYCLYDSGRNPEQLTDLETDPGEMQNLAGHPANEAALKKHRQLLKEWTNKIGDAIGTKYV
ncbi:MAG: sulfatase-like hydrolase/transferase, partial [Sedimentisphaerales bacterium]|nr:sulfatase-like hydrolase/transferase [Sedimentisphaerales bacterium]